MLGTSLGEAIAQQFRNDFRSLQARLSESRVVGQVLLNAGAIALEFLAQQVKLSRDRVDFLHGVQGSPMQRSG